MNVSNVLGAAFKQKNAVAGLGRGKKGHCWSTKYSE